MPIHTTLTRYAACALLAVAALFTTGCSRSVITTTVKPDGSFSRKIVFHGTSIGDKGLGGGGGGAPGGMGGELRDTFEMPAGGPWKTKREKTDSEEVYTAERDLTPGMTQKQDIAIKSGDKGKPGVFVVNEATVRNIGPGKWEYHETLHWNGKAPDMMDAVDPSEIKAIKAGLPAALATDTLAKQLAAAVNRELWHVMFGPGDPLISRWTQLMMQPELVERQMMSRMSPGIDKALIAQLGDKMSPEDRRACVRQIVGGMVGELNSKTGADPTKLGGDKPDFGNAALAALTFSVKLPGKIVSTNGERDDYTGEVYWAVYPQAAALGDVEMTAVCDTNAQ